MTRLSKLLRILLRFLLVWAVDAISLWVTALVLPGFDLVAREGYTSLTIAAVAALVLGLVNFLIRPTILLVARPFGMVVTFVVGFFVNALALIITSALLPGLRISGILPAVISGLVLAAVNTVLTGLLTLDDSDSFYEQRIRRLAQSSPFPDAHSGGQGLLVMEIDGVSYRHMQQALTLGYMPTLRSGGSSINNMFDGDAEKSLLTLSKLRADNPAEGKRRAEDVYLPMLNPYFFTRALALFLGEAMREVWQGFKQKVSGAWPRLNRLKKGYPFKRELMPRGATVVQTAGGDDGDANVFAMGAELQNAHQQDVGSRTGQAVARRAGELSQSATPKRWRPPTPPCRPPPPSLSAPPATWRTSSGLTCLATEV